jgi:hypothetical protein
MGHKDIASTAEPWLLLPILYSTKKQGQISEYSSKTSELAINEFIDNMPEQSTPYNKLLNDFLSSVYENYCQKGEVYFLDKTPRYYLIIPEIIKVFPNAKFVFLFRNPTNVYSSIIETWGEGRFKNTFNYEVDLNKGIKLLSEGCSLLKANSYSLRYEDLVINPKKILKDLFDYLELDFDESVLDNFSIQDTQGSFGDPTGVKDYSTIDTRPLNKWKNTFNTSFRKSLLSNYISKLDSNHLEMQGYSKVKILSEIKEIPVRQSFGIQDRIDYFQSKFVCYSKVNIFLGGSKRGWTKGLYLS